MTAAVLPAAPGPSLRDRTFGIPMTAGRQLARAAAVIVFVGAVCLLVELVVISGLQQRSAQQRAFDAFRSDLATGTAPVGPTDASGRLLPLGTPVAYVEIPAIGLRQVVGEGTDPATMFDGPGHRRDTALPGQVGTSMVLGRRSGFGGPFAHLDRLERGDRITVTTGQGTYDFTVRGVRHEGDPVPPPVAPGRARLLLVTAAGRPFMPSGVLRVDADLDGPAAPMPPRVLTSAALPAAEQIMGADTSTLWALALWLQALVAAALLAVWGWHRWGRARAWVVFVPVLFLIGVNVAGEAARVLPNLL